MFRLPAFSSSSGGLLFLFLLAMCSSMMDGTVYAQGDQLLEVRLFVSKEAPVITKESSGQTLKGPKDFFSSPSLIDAGGVMVAFGEGHTNYAKSAGDPFPWFTYSDIVAGYMDSSKGWQTLVNGVNGGNWDAYTVFQRESKVDHVGRALNPAAVARGNNVFLLVGSYYMVDNEKDGDWSARDWDLHVVVGGVTWPNKGNASELIKWGAPQSLMPQFMSTPQGKELKDFITVSGSGVLMADGTLVFPLMAATTGDTADLRLVSMIVYSKDDGQSWVLSKTVDERDCSKPAIVEWEKGKLLMIMTCVREPHKVFETSDMGQTWREAKDKLLLLQTDKPPSSPDGSEFACAFTTAIINGRKVILYTQKKYYSPSSTSQNKADLFLWATDNNRRFHVGPISVADDNVSQTFANTLMYSKDAGLYSLQDRGDAETKDMVLVNLDAEFKEINFVLSTWAKVDSFLTDCCASTRIGRPTGACKGAAMPITGLVGFLSNDAVGNAWKDKYLSVDAIVENGKKVLNGFEFAGHNSGAVWPVISFDQSGEYRFANYVFSLVATVAIHTTPTGLTPLMGASLSSAKWTKLIGVSYTADKKWVTVFNGTVKTTSVVLELGKEYKVAVTRRDNVGSVYIDGDLVGHSDKLPTYESESTEISDFYIGNVNEGQDADTKMNITVTNVFLYSRALSIEELKDPCNIYAPPVKGDNSVYENAGLRVPLLLFLLGFCVIGALW